MQIIPQTTHQMESISKKTSLFFHQYRIGQILRSANACKLKGFSAILVFLVLVSIIFENRSLYMQRRLHEESLPFGKDTAYRFLNSCHTNWRRFTLLLAARIINETIKPLTDAGRRCAIIVDDSLFSRCRRFALQPLALQARGTLGERLRPCEPPLYEGLPLARPRLDGREHVPATHVLPSFNLEGKEPAQ